MFQSSLESAAKCFPKLKSVAFENSYFRFVSPLVSDGVLPSQGYWYSYTPNAPQKKLSLCPSVRVPKYLHQRPSKKKKKASVWRGHCSLSKHRELYCPSLCLSALLTFLWFEGSLMWLCTQSLFLHRCLWGKLLRDVIP